MKCLYITLIILSVNASQASIYSNLKQNILSLFRRNSGDLQPSEPNTQELIQTATEPKLQSATLYSALKKNVLSLLPRSHSDVETEMEPREHELSRQDIERNDIEPKSRPMKHYHHKSKENSKDRHSKHKAKASKKQTHDEELNEGDPDHASNRLARKLNQNIIRQENYQYDPVLNQFRRFLSRRRSKAKNKQAKNGFSDSSSGSDMKNWMEELDEEMMHKKFEALNSSQHRGDVVNMAAARPWGVPCGDPNQHDMPWGSCTLGVECDAEVRIYRGDYFCGRTPFVCCAVEFTNYDMYQALDASFEDSSGSSDSLDAQGMNKNNNRKQRRREKIRARKERAKRKRLLKKNISILIKELKKVLNRAFRNGTAQRKRRTKELMKLVDDLKRKFRKDRNAFVTVHEYELARVDEDLQKRLDQVKDVNQGFMSNDTYRDIIVNGTVNKVKLLRMLGNNPEYEKLFQDLAASRRSSVNTMRKKKKHRNIREYDVEYGKIFIIEK